MKLGFLMITLAVLTADSDSLIFPAVCAFLGIILLGKEIIKDEIVRNRQGNQGSVR